MKNKRLLLSFFIAILCLFSLVVVQANAVDEYDISIKTVDYSNTSNLLLRSMSVPAIVNDIDHENVQIEKSCYTGMTFSLTAIITPPNAYVGEVVWSIEQDYEVAKIVSSNGLTASIKGMKAGVCTIVCRAADDQDAYTTCKLTVLQRTTEILLNPNNFILAPGGTQQILATVLPEDTSNQEVVWQSSNENIASVDENGVVTGITASAEPVTITCAALDGSGIYATAKVQVLVLVEKIEWDQNSFKNVIYKKGDSTETFTTVITPSNATIPTLRYSSSDYKVAMVVADKQNNNNVIITPKYPGKFILTCSATDGSGVVLKTEIEVVQLVEYVLLSETEKVLFLKNSGSVTHQLEVKTATPSYANILTSEDETKFIWTSDNEKVATVDATGLVTATNVGTVKITATANDVGKASATCTIHVRKPVTSMTIDLYSFEYIEGSASLSINLLNKINFVGNNAYVYSGDEVALNTSFNADATVKELVWQIAGNGVLADGTKVAGIYGQVADAYINPTVFTALPINPDNTDGYLNLVITCKAMDGSSISAQKIIQIRQPATSVSLDKTDITLYTKESDTDSKIFQHSETLIASILPENAYINKHQESFTDGIVKWSSSDTAVATVDERGVVTAVGTGTAIISGKSADGHGEAAECKVTVLQAISDLELYAYHDDVKIPILDNQILYAYTNQEIRIFTNIMPESASNQTLTWSSGNTLIATIDNGYLKVGDRTTGDDYVTITCATTDGSAKNVTFHLVVIDAEYEVELEEFVNVNSGDRENIFLKVLKNKTEGEQVVSMPVDSDIEVSISGKATNAEGETYTIAELYDANGNLIVDKTTLKNINSTSFDVKGLYNGVAVITFTITPKNFKDLAELDEDAILIGKNITFEKTCTVNVTGSDTRELIITQESIEVAVGKQAQTNALILPANAANCYIKYNLEAYDENYSNPTQYARVGESDGIVEGIQVGIVYVKATLYDSRTNKVVVTNGKEQVVQIPVYIKSSLESVSMDNCHVYVGETTNLLNYVTLSPAVLNQTVDKSTVIRFNVISGGDYIQFSSSASGEIKGLQTGIVRIQAIASYGDKHATSAEAQIEVRNRLTSISLPDTYHIKLNQIITLTPERVPYNGDILNAEISWSSSDSNVATVEKSATGFGGIVTGLKAGTTKISVTVITDKNVLKASTNVTVIPIDVTDFSADNSGKLYKLSTVYTPYYRWGAYHITSTQSGSASQAAGCLENGSFSLSTVYLRNVGYTSYYKNRYYPSFFSLRSFSSLEATEDILKDTAMTMGYMSSKSDSAGWNEFLGDFNEALKTATAIAGRYDSNAYIDLPGKSHFLKLNGNTYSNKNFSKWGHSSVSNNIKIFVGLTSLVEKGKTTEEILQKIKVSSTDVNSSWSRLSNSYFTSALTSLNVVTGKGNTSVRMANALSILLTYFPLDDMVKNGELVKNSDDYRLMHSARQMLIWTISGVHVSRSQYKALDKLDPNNTYHSTSNHYNGNTNYYVCYMLQAESEENNANYMEYPFGYSAFYKACTDILGAPGVRFYSVKSKIMPIVEGFIWKMDQCKQRTIPSFAHTSASLASKNPVQLYKVNGGYSTVLNDTNGVLNYYHFNFQNLITFTNNGDGTLSIFVPDKNVEKVKELQSKHQYATIFSGITPEDNKYTCAAFVKHELESEVVQLPYTTTSGNLAYAYLLGQNVQSQVISTPIESDLGDPIVAVLAFAFNEDSQFDSEVESDVKLLNADGQEVEYVIPNEQYQLKYIYTYVGSSRNLNLVNTNEDNSRKVSTNLYGFAADMRARTTIGDSLLTLVEDGQSNKYTVIKSSATSSTPYYELFADKVDVTINGSYKVYNTPGGSTAQTWDSGTAWNDSIYIDANLGRVECVTKNEMISSSNYPGRITVVKDGETVTITWTYYTGYLTFTTPYVKASADITIAADSEHPATKAQNVEYGNKYVYGLTLNGNQSVKGSEASSSIQVNNFNDYKTKYEFTGMVENAVNLTSTFSDLSDLPYLLFDGLGGYTITKNDVIIPLSELSFAELMTAGTEKSSNWVVGDVYYFYNTAFAESDIIGVAIYVGSHNNDQYYVYAKLGEKFTGGYWNEAVRAIGANNYTVMNYEGCVDLSNSNPDTGNVDDNEGGSAVVSSATLNTTGNTGVHTEFKNSSYFNTKNYLDEFTMTNPFTYGGSGYLTADLEYVQADNAQNYASFHTDKTFMTVFDLSISNLVVNTGAGITSPTSVDTRNLVNLNVYYTLNLDNSAYKIITNRYGKVGNVWIQYYKDIDSNGELESTAQKYYYRRVDFYYLDASGNKQYCTANTTPVAGRTYYYDYVYPDGKKITLVDKDSSIKGTPDFIPDDRQNIFYATSANKGTADAYTVPAGWADEKELNIVIHTDTFTEFCIYDNEAISNEANKLSTTAFPSMNDEQKLAALEKINTSNEVATTMFFIDNIQTGDNYIQHSVPYVLTATEAGVKVFGFAAYVNTTHNNASGVALSTGENIYVNRALAEWGRKVGSYTDSETLLNSNSGRTHYNYSTDVTNTGNINCYADVLNVGASLLGHEVSNMKMHQALGVPVKLSNGKYKNYYYASEYDWSYENNKTATSLLQYPSYNPHTLSTLSTNGSLIYKNNKNVTGFDMTLGNNQLLHIPSVDNISYVEYQRVFGTEGNDNAGPIKNTWATQHKGTVTVDGIVKVDPYSEKPSSNETLNFQYGSLNFFKYSDTNYNLAEANGAYVSPSEEIDVESAIAETDLENTKETESLKLDKIYFRSTYTVSHGLGEDGWVDVTEGSNEDALVNAGKGFELKVQVVYQNTNLTDYLARYLKDSAQVEGIASSTTSGVSDSTCNISVLTGQYGEKSMKDPYTSKVLSDEDWNDVFGANLYKDLYVIMNNNTKYVYSYSGVYGSTQVFDVDIEYNYVSSTNFGEVVMTYTMKQSAVNGFYGTTGNASDKSGLATQAMKFYTDSSAAGTVGSLTIWTNPIAATPFGYPGNMQDRYIADLKQIQYYIIEPVDNVDNIVQ